MGVPAGRTREALSSYEACLKNTLKKLCPSFARVRNNEVRSCILDVLDSNLAPNLGKLVYVFTLDVEAYA
jgi:hypothetical protein